MKKLFCLLTALLLLAAALPLTASAEEPTVSPDQIVDFNVVLDKVPEGVEVSFQTVQGAQYLFFTPEDEAGCEYIASVEYSEMFAGYTYGQAELTDAELAQMEEFLTSDYSEGVTVTYGETSHGTKVIIVDENNPEIGDFGDVLTIYEGYVFCVSLLKSSALTQEDFDVALQIMSDLWVAPVKK